MKYITIVLTTILIAITTIPKSEYQVTAEFSDTKGVEEVSPEVTGVTSIASSSPSVSEEYISDTHIKTNDNGQNMTNNMNEIEQMICTTFGEHCNEARAVFKAESGLRPDAQGYNCWFENGQVVAHGTWATHKSGACPPDQRHLAWSVDCGIAQMNVAGQTCPQEYLDPKWNIEKAYEWKFLTRNKTFTAWVAYTSGSYKRFLTSL